MTWTRQYDINEKPLRTPEASGVASEASQFIERICSRGRGGIIIAMPIEEQNAVSEQETAAAPKADEKPATSDAASIDVSQYPTIDNDWDKLAAEYPETYERFANAPNDS